MAKVYASGTHMIRRGVLLACSGVLIAGPAAAQQAPADRFALEPAQQQREVSELRPLRIAKWSSLTFAAGFAVYGFSRSNHADDTFRSLEEACNRAPARCASRGPQGAYVDAELEGMFQDVLAADRQARSALIISQIGVAATVVLFLLDLRNAKPPDDIPYVPRGLSIGRNCESGDVCLRWSVNLPR